MITISELLNSEAAKYYSLKNEPPSPEVWRNLCDLLTVINHVRAKYGKPIIVTSGYRSPPLNLRVGGAKNSAHMFGLAIDVKTEKNNADYLAISKIFPIFAKQLGYNSIVIMEKPINGVPQWLHLELTKTKPSKIFTLC